MHVLSPVPPKADEPRATHAIIDHVLTRYHEMHRADLAVLLPLVDRVERVHAEDSAAPRGLTQAVKALAQGMESHMVRAERIFFPALRAGGGKGCEHAVASMRADYHDHAGKIEAILRLTQDLTPPVHACGPWRALYRALGMLFEDLATQIAFANDALFPRLDPHGARFAGC